MLAKRFGMAMAHRVEISNEQTSFPRLQVLPSPRDVGVIGLLHSCCWWMVGVHAVGALSSNEARLDGWYKKQHHT